MLWPHNVLWSTYVGQVGNDLTELTVYPGATAADDEIFVGQGRDASTYQYGVCGYFRYGKYPLTASQEVTGWIHFHRTDNEGGGAVPRIHTAQWTAGPIHETLLADEQAGWHRFFPSLRALVPFARHPVYRHLMVGVDYGIPLMTQDGGATWANLYCKSSPEGGWESRGLNLMCARSSVLLADGRLVMAAWDYGAFIGSSSENTGFTPLHDPQHATPPLWPRGEDVAAIQTPSGAEVYLVDGEDNWDSGDTDATVKRDKIWRWTGSGTGPVWALVSDAIANAVGAASGMDISDIVTVGQDTMYAAVGAHVSGWERHYFICEGTRTSTGWDWRKAYDLDALSPGHATKIIQELCRIPGTRRLLFGSKFQNGTGGPSSGGLYCVDDYQAATWQVTPWLEGGAGLMSGDARGRLARNVTAIAVDSLSSVVYAGCSGHDSPWTQGRGGVVRFELSGGAPTDTTILAGGEDWTSDAFGIGDVVNFPGGVDPAAWEYFTHVYDLEVDPQQPMVVYAAVGNGSYFDSSFGAWSFRGNSWVRECDVPEAGSGGATVSLARTRNRLYLGTFAQEFFVADVDVPPVPTIASSAYGPIWSTGHTALTTICVSITHPGALAMSTVELYPDALGVTGPLAMYDGGPDVSPGTDLVAGDQIYTSASFSSNVAAGTYQVRVFAQATDGGYDEATVTVEAVPYAAKFHNVSSGPEAGLLGLNYSGTPYSAVSFDYNEDLKKDLLITQSDDVAVIYGETAISPSGTPSFESRATFGASGWRGAASADYDNDGHVDIFLAGTSSAVLLKNGNSGFSGTDVTTEEDLSGIDNAVAACWGDYNRDGWLDLYVVRGSTTTGSPGEVDHGLQHRLFENRKGEGGHFVDVTDAAGLKDLAAIPSTSASWADVDLDGDLDLFVAMAPFVPDSFKSPSQPLPIASRLFLNQDDGTFVQGFDSRFAEQMTGISAAVWADVNNDFWPDLLLGMRGFGARAYLNDGTGHFDTPAVKLQDEAMGYDGLAITDQDLDGWQDVLLAPSGPGRPVSLLLNKEWSGHRGFAEASVAAGLDGVVPVSGLLATDFTRDGDTELFAGMQATVHNFFYKTDAQDGTSRLSGAYVKVRLESTSRGNPQDGTGARVVIAAVPGGGAIGLPQMQVVDGGSGRGSQRDRDLLFGLGNYEGSVVATVFWPGGGTQTAVPLIVSNSTGSETINIITDTTAPTVSNVSVESLYDPSSNTLTWTFFWDTDMNSNWKDDEIQFVNYVQGYCSPGGDGVMATDPGVSHSYVAKPGGGYRHSIVISDVECFAPCRFTYRVGSGKGPGKSYSPYYQKRTLVCPSQF